MRKRLVWLVVLLLLPALVPFHAVSLPDLDVHLVRISMAAERGTSLVQGKRFLFGGSIANQLPVPMAGKVTIALSPPDGSAPHLIDTWTGTLAGGASSDFEYEINPAQFFAQTGQFSINASGAFHLVQVPQLTIDSPTATLPFTVNPPPVAPVVFEDVTDQMGITTTMGPTDCENYAAGAAWVDINNDGKLDLYILNRANPAQLWINEGDHFVEDAAAYGLTLRNPDGTYPIAIGANFTDYDNDGRKDLIVTINGGNRLFHNDGGGVFTDVTNAAGLGGVDGNFTTASWADYDGDGNLDLFIASHGRRKDCRDDFTVYKSHLYHNNGNGTFADVTDLLPDDGTFQIGSQGLGFIGAWMDYNNDGREDLYLGNDHIRRYNPTNELWRNDGLGSDGNWKFTNVSIPSGAGLGMNAMGAGIGDYNRDGFLDAAFSNIGPLVLMRNHGDGTWTDDSVEAGTDRGDQGNGASPVTWAVGMIDFNNDGWDDIYVAAGELDEGGGGAGGSPPAPNGDPKYFLAQPNMMFVNDGTGRFLDLSADSKADDPKASRGIAFADYDGDGKMDMFMIDLNDKVKLFHNVTVSTDHWSELDLTTHGRDACGANLVAEWPGKQLPPIRNEVACGATSLASGSDPTVHFGLGTQIKIDRLTITWPDLTQQVLTDVPADVRMEVPGP